MVDNGVKIVVEIYKFIVDMLFEVFERFGLFDEDG